MSDFDGNTHLSTFIVRMTQRIDGRVMFFIWSVFIVSTLFVNSGPADYPAVTSLIGKRNPVPWDVTPFVMVTSLLLFFNAGHYAMSDSKTTQRVISVYLLVVYGIVFNRFFL